MLSIRDPRSDRNCQGLVRREFLKIGALGVGGLALSNLLSVRSALAKAGRPVKDKSVVLLFLQGGPSHIELFDPKMTAPAEIRSIFGEVQTAIPGVTFGGTFPKLAGMADKLTVVRSYASRNSGHSYQEVASGRNATGATMSALYARVAGTNHPATGMPRNVLVLPEAVQPNLTLQSNFETGALPTLTTPGGLGASYAAFNPSGGGELKQNMELKIDARRFGHRRNLLSQLDGVRRRIDASGQMEGADEFRRQAVDVILQGVADAFDLSKEDPRTLEKYDTSSLFPIEAVTRWHDMKRASNLLGKQMLLARRLCERGCGFVTVSDCGWDMHSNNNSPKFLGAMKYLGPQVDHAVAAFIEDVRERGLEDKILLAVTGEMGRTPRINNNGGRDHYGDLTPLALFGGGLKMGQVIGQSDGHATRPATEPFEPGHLLATIMHTLFDLGELRIERGIPRDVLQAVSSNRPIDGLL